MGDMRLRDHVDGTFLGALEQPHQDRLQLFADRHHPHGVGRVGLRLRAADGQRLLLSVQVGPFQLAELGRAPENCPSKLLSLQLGLDSKRSHGMTRGLEDPKSDSLDIRDLLVAISRMPEGRRARGKVW